MKPIMIIDYQNNFNSDDFLEMRSEDSGLSIGYSEYQDITKPISYREQQPFI